MLLSDRQPPAQHTAGSTVDPAADDDVVRASEALVRGALTRHLRAEHRPVPPWALLNQVAHGTLDDLLAAATGADGSPTEVSLARAVLARVADGQALAQLQSTFLVPLEHTLSEEIVSPRRILELVTDELFG